jgi:hypothetical protein
MWTEEDVEALACYRDGQGSVSRRRSEEKEIPV